MCDGRPIPQSLSASRDRNAHPAGIMALPGMLLSSRMRSRPRVARSWAIKEQAAELRAQRSGAQVQLALVRDGGGPDAALLRPAPAQPPEARPLLAAVEKRVILASSRGFVRSGVGLGTGRLSSFPMATAVGL